MILWRQTGLIGKVTAVRDSDLSINKDDKRQPDSIDVLITLAVPKGQRPDFLVLVNPEDTKLAEQAIDAVLAERGAGA